VPYEDLTPHKACTRLGERDTIAPDMSTGITWL